MSGYRASHTWWKLRLITWLSVKCSQSRYLTPVAMHGWAPSCMQLFCKNNDLLARMSHSYYTAAMHDAFQLPSVLTGLSSLILWRKRTERKFWSKFVLHRKRLSMYGILFYEDFLEWGFSSPQIWQLCAFTAPSRWKFALSVYRIFQGQSTSTWQWARNSSEIVRCAG